CCRQSRSRRPTGGRVAGIVVAAIGSTLTPVGRGGAYPRGNGRRPPGGRTVGPMTDTTTTDTAAIARTIDAYFPMPNQADDARRAELAEVAWDPNGVYVDPLGRHEGPTAIAQMVGAVQQQYPGHRFARTSGIDTHHKVVRFSWDFAA